MAEPNLIAPTVTPQDVQNFWSKVEKGLGPNGECWVRKRRDSAKDRRYRSFRLASGQVVQNHRLAYYLAHNEWLGEYLACHTCDYPPCCNPAHIFKGTNTDNVRDCYQKNRHPIMRGESHGNAVLTDENVIEMRVIYATGTVSYLDLAERYGVSPHTIAAAVTGETWKHLDGAVPGKSPVSRGEKIGTAKLTERIIEEIKRKYRPRYYSYQKLANEYGVHADTIANVLKGHTWAHLKRE